MGVAISPSGTFLYVYGYVLAGSTDVTVWARSSRRVPAERQQPALSRPAIPNIPIGIAPIGVNALPNGSTLYVISKGGDTQLGRVYSFNANSDGAWHRSVQVTWLPVSLPMQ